MEQYNILVVDDDREIVDSLSKLLELEGYAAYRAYDGMEAIQIMEQKKIHLILLDVMMPRLNGLSALMKIREKENIPVIMLSAKTEESDKVLGLSMGADDYVTKPYQATELMARVKSQLRRYFTLGAFGKTDGDVLKNGGLVIDRNAKEVLVDGEKVKLTPTEYRILEFLTANRGRVFSAEEIYDRVWKEPIGYAVENTVMVHIRRIREKIEINPKNPQYLKVVWGIGYKIEKID